MSQFSPVTSAATVSASSIQEDRFGRAIAARLAAGHASVPHDIGQRLRVAREQAVARRKREVTAPVAVLGSGGGGGGQASLGLSRWWSWGACALPLVVLVVGLVTITQWQADERAAEIAEIDAALLTGDLPTAAYTDPGFMQFLQRDLTTH